MAGASVEVLPQVVEGVLTVLVLYRAVRQLAGPAAGITAGPGPAGAVDRVALCQAAPAPEPPPGPVRQLLLREPGAGQPVGCPSDRSTHHMMPPCPSYPAPPGVLQRHHHRGLAT